MHLGRGFKSLGVYHNTGYKCGSWHDVEWFEKQLLPYDAEPQPVRPITVVAAESISEIDVYKRQTLRHRTNEEATQ